MASSNTDLFGDPLQKKLGIGYAGHPGMGPKGETCGSCRHRQWAGRITRRYYKCGHQYGYRSFSQASDIKLKTPACEHWELG